ADGGERSSGGCLRPVPARRSAAATSAMADVVPRRAANLARPPHSKADFRRPAVLSGLDSVARRNFARSGRSFEQGHPRAEHQPHSLAADYNPAYLCRAGEVTLICCRSKRSRLTARRRRTIGLILRLLDLPAPGAGFDASGLDELFEALQVSLDALRN